MKGLLVFIFSIIVTVATSKEKVDSLKSPLEVSGEVVLNANGIAPIPAFTFGKPTIMASITLKKNRFSYNPQLSYGLNFKPWIFDNWFHYLLVKKPKFEMRVGMDISMFFSEYQTPDEVILQGQRYFAFELAGKYHLTEKSALSLMFWSDNGIDPGSISGYYLNLEIDRIDISIGKHIIMEALLQIFYIDYTDDNDGLFISPKISFSSTDIPVFIFGQGILPLISNITPYPDIQWNIGLGYSF